MPLFSPVNIVKKKEEEKAPSTHSRLGEKNDKLNASILSDALSLSLLQRRALLLGYDSTLHLTFITFARVIFSAQE